MEGIEIQLKKMEKNGFYFDSYCKYPFSAYVRNREGKIGIIDSEGNFRQITKARSLHATQPLPQNNKYI